MKIMEQIDGVSYPSASTDVAERLTRAMILHPIAFSFAFIAFLLAIRTGLTSSIHSMVVAAFAWLLTLTVLITDFVGFGIVKKHVNGDGSGSSAAFGVSMWTLVAAMVVLFLGMIFVFLRSRGAQRYRYRGVSKG